MDSTLVWIPHWYGYHHRNWGSSDLGLLLDSLQLHEENLWAIMGPHQVQAWYTMQQWSISWIYIHTDQQGLRSTTMHYFCAHFGIRGISEVGNTQADALSHNWLPIICTHVIAMGRSFFAVIHTHCHAFLPGSLNPVATADCPATPKLNSTVGFHWTRMVCVLQPHASIYPKIMSTM